MNNSTEIHERHRRSIRLRGYDYTQNGAYFVTICTRNREHLFGEIENGEMRVNPAGNMINRWWHELGNRFPEIELDAFVVMPNHIHGIIVIKRDPMQEQGEDKPSPVRAPLVGALPPHSQSKAIGDIVGAFKSLTANEYIRRVKTKEFPRFEKSIWHRNYYERIIRNDDEWNRIREYIEKNPDTWADDELNSA